jgi:hydrogenase small subunit
MQYCTASAAVLGLSQTDLLRLEKALATPQPATSQPSPSVIWLSAQACSGCPVSLLNRVNKEAGVYYDADMLNQLYGTSLTTPSLLGDDAKGLPLQVVNDAADLLVGDGVRALTGITRTRAWADDIQPYAPAGGLLSIYGGAFPTGYITLDWNATVMAAAGDIAAGHLANIRNGSGLLGVFVVVVDGSIPAGEERYCYVFDNIDDTGNKVISTLPLGDPVTAGEALQWLASASGCIGVISQGTCASFGGIPAGRGNKTGAMSVADYLASKSIGTPVINVPGCPPHPDWTVYPVAYLLALSTPTAIAYPPVDRFGRPIAVFQGSQGGITPETSDEYTPFCHDCPNKPTQNDGAIRELGDAGCLGPLGCKGPYTVGDCPIRGKNTSDDGFSMNWCVGASGASGTGAPAVSHIGNAQHPCQGCIMPDFPDWKNLTGSGVKTNKNVKGFYNE